MSCELHRGAWRRAVISPSRLGRYAASGGGYVAPAARSALPSSARDARHLEATGVHINTRRVAFVRMTGRRDGVQPSGEGEERRDASPEAGPRATHYERSVTVPPDIG